MLRTYTEEARQWDWLAGVHAPNVRVASEASRLGVAWYSLNSRLRQGNEPSGVQSAQRLPLGYAASARNKVLLGRMNSFLRIGSRVRCLTTASITGGHTPFPSSLT